MFIIYRDQSAMTPLRDTWEQAEPPLREAIVQASRRIDQQLQFEPLEQGESRADGTRIVFAAPLAMLYEVDVARQVVRILRGWIFRTAFGRRDCSE